MISYGCDFFFFSIGFACCCLQSRRNHKRWAQSQTAILHSTPLSCCLLPAIDNAAKKPKGQRGARGLIVLHCLMARVRHPLSSPQRIIERSSTSKDIFAAFLQFYASCYHGKRTGFAGGSEEWGSSVGPQTSF